MNDHSSGAASAGLWRGTSRADRDGERRERLLEAALELYGTLGFRATSIQALCQESGVSSRSFYDLFPAHRSGSVRESGAVRESITAQESLLEQLYAVLNEEIVDALTTLTIPAGASLVEATVNVVSAALMPMLGDERKARVLEVEAVGVNESLEARRRETMRILAAAVDAAFVRVHTTYELPEIPALQKPDELGFTSLILVGGITEALVQRVQTPAADRTSTSEFLTRIAEVALRAYGVSPTSEE
ncbi:MULTISPECIES: TetR/AcrR family transcriptional regulator [unclassified Brevibacterium]|uniref:TetR/AcrR family transcriptional regulator n=1 Tax=unclassified Brevibacterium TaxID=2614124 RepID=UPI000C38F47E|nr:MULTISPECIES: TetR/AcrR family transcriptional regulator [unclassified Brevibacterium]SMX84669.1 transcriptional regulator, TetR family [Brevibacterium sp. 239c]